MPEIPRYENPQWTIDGYWHGSGVWVPGMINNETYLISAPQYAYGAVVYYAPYIMEATAAYRGYSLKDYQDGIALMSPSDLGKTVWLRRPGGDWEGPFLVVDCARRHDMFPAVYYRREIAELGFETAVAWGLAKYGGKGNNGRWTALSWILDNVEVWVGDEPPDNPGRPIDYVNWWLWQIEWATKIEERVYPDD